MNTQKAQEKGLKNWVERAREVLEGHVLQRKEALAILQTKDEEILELLSGAYLIRRNYFGNKVKLNLIANVKSGHCSEDCGYCSQSKDSTAPIQKYTMLSKDEIVKGAQKALEMNAGTYCIVASGRKPTEPELDQVIEAVKEIKKTMKIKICACLGLITVDQAIRLKEAGVERFNHNINTSEAHHGNITTTHTYQDRVRTVEIVKATGMSPCSGCIVGMGETDEDIVDMAFALRELDADSIPVNFLTPIPGTKLGGLNQLTPTRCLKVLAMFRFVCPSKEIRISGGREVNLRSLQPLGLYVGNSIFIGDYLTTGGQEASQDYQMLADMGFEME
ncbi:biotin synthase BioB [Microaerobacter geothermalis]|uniref:biotin synthase BioB n=1 Tax=Microaerobacter geothermalis TaxID=674972 RepID=UPI001F3231C8|nr:biotin synthase BioB [Microaerobacter geothermalis]